MHSLSVVSRYTLGIGACVCIFSSYYPPVTNTFHLEWRPLIGHYNLYYNPYKINTEQTNENSYLWMIAISGVYTCHGLQPRLPEFWRAGVGVCQTVLQIHQHLRVSLVFLHLCRGHHHRLYTLCQVLHLRRKLGFLQCNRTTCNHFCLPGKSVSLKQTLDIPNLDQSDKSRNTEQVKVNEFLLLTC